MPPAVADDVGDDGHAAVGEDRVRRPASSRRSRPRRRCAARTELAFASVISPWRPASTRMSQSSAKMSAFVSGLGVWHVADGVVLPHPFDRARDVDPSPGGNGVAVVGDADDLRAQPPPAPRPASSRRGRSPGSRRARRQLDALGGAAAAMQRCAPRAVALRRPRVPPTASGLPITEAETVWPRCIDSVSMIHAIVCEPVLTSGEGMSLSGPMSDADLGRVAAGQALALVLAQAARVDADARRRPRRTGS